MKNEMLFEYFKDSLPLHGYICPLLETKTSYSLIERQTDLVYGVSYALYLKKDKDSNTAVLLCNGLPIEVVRGLQRLLYEEIGYKYNNLRICTVLFSYTPTDCINICDDNTVLFYGGKIRKKRITLCKESVSFFFTVMDCYKYASICSLHAHRMPLCG